MWNAEEVSIRISADGDFSMQWIERIESWTWVEIVAPGKMVSLEIKRSVLSD